MELFNEVLLVDDDKHTNFFNYIMLEEMKLAQRVHFALDGMEALKLIQEGQALKNDGDSGAYLILLDIQMPVMGGFEFLEQLSGYKDLAKEKIYVVLLTSLTDRYYDKKARDFKITTILNKPLTPEKFKLISKEIAKRDLY